jgi:hypothetical protein
LSSPLSFPSPSSDLAFNAIKNSIGGSQWDDVDDTPSSLGAGVTVLKIQVGGKGGRGRGRGRGREA